MNYKIYSTGGTVTIGTDTITATPINLMDLNSLDFDSLQPQIFNAVKDGSLMIQKGGEDVENPIKVISRAIQYVIDDEEEDHLLFDYSERKRTKKLTPIDVSLLDIDRGYNDKTKAGELYHRKTRAQWVKDVNNGTLTSADLFFIDKKIMSAKKSLIDGDWITARHFIEESTAEGVYTTEIRQQFLDDINTHIATLYI